jgi:hypothetical protein
MANLVSLSEIKDFLSIKTINTDEDGRLANIASQVSTLVESYCGRNFSANNYTEYFDGGISSVFVSYPPINRVDEVAHYDGKDFVILGGPGVNGEPIIIEGQSHTINSFGSPILSTRVKKFNRSSAKFNGSSYLATDSNSDWDFGVDSFTIEAQVRFDNVSSNTQTIISSGTTTDNWELSIDFDSNGLQFKTTVNSIETISVSQGSSSDYVPDQFYHIALVRDNSVITLYRNGVSVASITTLNSIPNFNTGLYIAKGVTSNYLSGYLDDLKISHIAEYTANFTAPTYPTRIDENTKLMMRFDGANNTGNFNDVSRKVNEFNFYSITGEISFNTGDGGGTPKLGFFRPLKFYNYPNGVRVNYNGGYKTIPQDLKLATLELVKVIYKGRSGTESVRMQGENINSFKLSTDEFPPQVRRVLNLYRLVK